MSKSIVMDSEGDLPSDPKILGAAILAAWLALREGAVEGDEAVQLRAEIKRMKAHLAHLNAASEGDLVGP